MYKKSFCCLVSVVSLVGLFLLTGFKTQEVEAVPFNQPVAQEKQQLVKLEAVEEYVQQEEELSGQEFEYTVQSGDTLSSIWQNLDNDYSLVLAANNALKDADVNLNYFFRTGAKLDIVTDATGLIDTVERRIEEGKKLSLKYNPDTLSYSLDTYEPKVITKEREVSAEIQGSIAATAMNLNLDYSLVDKFVDLFSSRIEFSRDIHPGDSFALIYEERTLESGEKLTPGMIHGAILHSQGATYAAIQQVSEVGETFYFDENGDVLGNFFLRYPVNFTRISSVFSKNRFHPVLKRNRPHNGVDFAAPTGTPVRAVADGVIEAAAYGRANGNWVKIRHSKRYQTAYLHLSKIAKGIKKGTKVARGQLIGNVGSTGLSSGPHLHYSFYDNGRYVDPLKIKLPSIGEDQKIIDHMAYQTMLARLGGL